MPKHSKARVAEIRGTLGDLARSGQSVAAFARERGMPAWTLYDWRRRYGDGADGSVEQTGGEPGAEIVRVEVTEQQRSKSAFEVEIGEFSICVSAGFDASELSRLLRVLRSC